MKRPFLSWTDTFRKLGFKRVWREGARRPERGLGRRERLGRKEDELGLHVEALEARQMLSGTTFTVSNVSLVNDTGTSSTDQITSDPEISGSVGGVPAFFNRIEFDHYGDGSVDSTIDVTVGSSFNYDPSVSDPSVSSHIGDFDLKYRTVAFDALNNPLGYGNWETFTYSLELDNTISLQVVDDATSTVVTDGSGSVSLGVVPLGQSVQRTFTINNTGSGELTLDRASLTFPADFSLVTPFDSVVAPGGSTSFTLEYQANSGGYQSGTIAFNAGGDRVTLNANFGTDGEVTADFHGSEDRASGIAVQPDGKVIVTGSTRQLTPDAGTTDAMLFDGGNNSKSVIGYTSINSDSYIPVDVDETYRLSATLSSGDGSGGNLDPAARHYVGFSSYDIDHNIITPKYYYQMEGAVDTYLAAALNPGDTTITLVDATGWYNGATSSKRNLVWYGYSDSTGHTYADFTYTRNLSSNLWASGGISGNVITLSAPWAGPAVASGTAVRNTRDSGTYNYSLVENQAISATPTNYSAVINPFEPDEDLKFRPGTAYIKAKVLANLNNAPTNQLNVSDFKLEAYDNDMQFSGSGSKSVVGYSSINSDSYIPVDADGTYRLSAILSSGDESGGNVDPAASHYVGFSSYDIDHNIITPTYYHKMEGATDTYLAADVNPGDTTITLVDASGWYDGTSSSKRNLVWYGYSDSTGHVYEDFTYTRNRRSNLWASGGISGNVITLSAPWTGPAVAAGTAVRNTRDHGTYSYALRANQTVSTTPTSYSAVISPFSSDNDLRFRPGTAYIKAKVLANYSNGSTNQFNVSDFKLEAYADHVGLTRYNADGTLDTSFGSGGQVTTDLSGSAFNHEFGQSVTVQPDGKILVAGYQSTEGLRDDLILLRYNADGTLDTSFGGGDGIVTDDFGGDADARAEEVIYEGGKILVVGKRIDHGATTPSWDVFVARYNSDGTLDTTFGSSGVTITDVTGADQTDQGYSVGVQSTGEILVAGRFGNATSGQTEFGVLRLTSSGVLDTTFGSGGIVSTDITGSGDDGAYQVLVKSDDSFYLTGTGNDQDFAVAAYTSAGALDVAFGTAGIVTVNLGSRAKGYRGALKSDGKIVVVGTVDNGSTGDPLWEMVAVQLSADGTLDTGFGVGGKEVLSGEHGTARDVVASGDGFIVAGHKLDSATSTHDLTIAKYLAQNTINPATGMTFDFTVTADVDTTLPDIEIRGPGAVLIASPNGTVDFGTATVAVPLDIGFTIHNTGTDDLNLDLSSVVLPGDYSLLTPPPAVIGAAGSANFTIRLDAGTAGVHAGTFSIGSDDPDTPTYSFTLTANVNQTAVVAVDHFGLVNDTGSSNSDDKTYDPRMKGRVVGDFQGGYVWVEFDHVGDGTISGSELVDTTGDWFEYDPRVDDVGFANVTGVRDVKYRFVRYDNSGVVQETSGWTNFQFTLEDDPTLGDLTVDHFGLVLDTVVPNDDRQTTLPIMTGVVNGTIGSGHVEVQFAHDTGLTVDGVVTITESGSVFSYDMNDAGSPIPLGLVELSYRLVKFDDLGAVVDTGNWASFDFTLIGVSPSTLTVDDLGLVLDTGASDNDLTTHDGRVSGKIGGTTSTTDSYTVQFDLTGDGNAEVTVPASLDPLSGEIVFEADLTEELPYGQTTIQGWVRYFDAGTGSYRVGPSSPFTLTLEAAPAATFATIELANDTGDDEATQSDGSTLDPTVRGQLDEATGPVDFTKVEFDLSGNGAVDEVVWTNEGGEFSLTPAGLAFDVSHTIQLRSARYDTKLGDYVTGDWQPFTFTLESPTLPTIDEFTLVSGDGSGNALTADDRLRGSIDGENPWGTTIEFDYGNDGTVDARTTADYVGNWIHDPVGLASGSNTISVRVVGWDEYNQAELPGPWTTDTFVLQTAALNAPYVTGLGLVEDTGDDTGDDVTTNGTISGKLEVIVSDDNPEDVVAYKVVEIDTDGDQVADAQTRTDGEGNFQYLADWGTTGSKTISVRGSTYDYTTNQTVFGNWESYTFELTQEVAQAATLTEFGFWANTGISQTDTISGNKTLTGVVDNPSGLGGLVIEFDEDGDTSTIEGAAFVDGENRFHFTPGPYSYGVSVTVSARTVGWDYENETYLPGSWTPFTFTFEDPVNAAPIAVDLELVEDTGTAGDNDSSQTAIQGRLLNEKSLNGLTVEIDVDDDGTSDFTTTTDRWGRFYYAPQGLAEGVHTIRVRGLEIDYQTGNLLEGAWESITFTYTAALPPFPGVMTVGLVEDTGTDNSDGVTENPSLSGTVDSEGLSLLVQFDHDNDGIVDGSTYTNSDGEFSYTPVGLDPGAQTIRMRVRSIGDDGVPQYTAWADTSVTFTLEAPLDTSLRVDTLTLTNDSGASTSDGATADAAIGGTIAGATDPTGMKVEFDVDGDGVAEGEVLADANGDFAFTPELEGNDHYNVRARVVTTDSLGLEVPTEWTTLSFVYHNDPDGTEAQAMLLAASDYDTDVDNFRNTYENQSRTADTTYRQNRQNVLATYESALASARTIYRNSGDSARDIYLNSLELATAQHRTDLEAALAVYQNNLPTGQRDIDAFHVPEVFNPVEFQLPDEAQQIPLPAEKTDLHRSVS